MTPQNESGLMDSGPVSPPKRKRQTFDDELPAAKRVRANSLYSSTKCEFVKASFLSHSAPQDPQSPQNCDAVEYATFAAEYYHRSLMFRPELPLPLYDEDFGEKVCRHFEASFDPSWKSWCPTSTKTSLELPSQDIPDLKQLEEALTKQIFGTHGQASQAAKSVDGVSANRSPKVVYDMRKFTASWRRHKYGDEIAAEFEPGYTPKYFRIAYVELQAMLEREFEEAPSPSEGLPWPPRPASPPYRAEIYAS